MSAASNGGTASEGRRLVAQIKSGLLDATSRELDLVALIDRLDEEAYYAREFMAEEAQRSRSIAELAAFEGYQAGLEEHGF